MQFTQPDSWQEVLGIKVAHPEVGARAVFDGSGRLSPQEYEMFTGMNRSHREKFGIPFDRLHDGAHQGDYPAGRRRAAGQLRGKRRLERALAETSKIARLRLGVLDEEGGKR